MANKTAQETAAEKAAQAAYERWKRIDSAAADAVRKDTYRRLTEKRGAK